MSFVEKECGWTWRRIGELTAGGVLLLVMSLFALLWRRYFVLLVLAVATLAWARQWARWQSAAAGLPGIAPLPLCGFPFWRLWLARNQLVSNHPEAFWIVVLDVVEA